MKKIPSLEYFLFEDIQITQIQPLFKSIRAMFHYALSCDSLDIAKNRGKSEDTNYQAIVNIIKGRRTCKAEYKSLLIYIVNEKIKELGADIEIYAKKFSLIIEEHNQVYHWVKGDESRNFLDYYNQQDSLNETDMIIAPATQESQQQKNIDVKKTPPKEQRVRMDDHIDSKTSEQDGYTQTQWLNALEIGLSKHTKISIETITKILHFMGEM